MAERKRQLRRATVVEREWLSPDMVRLQLTSDDMIGVELGYTDHYIKLLFPPQGAGYAWPFDPEEIKANQPAELWPVTRTYTIRAADPRTGRITVDFVIHGDKGLAGPWAAAAEPGSEIGFFGPGGAWGPGEYERFVLVGDEAAAPAICAAIEALPSGAEASVFLEVASDGARFEVPTGPGVAVTWVARDGAPYGRRLAEAVRAAGSPEGAAWFVHGVADMVKDLRRFLFVESGVPRGDVSISGYWRAGLTEDGWQSTKHEFVAQMEAEEGV